MDERKVNIKFGEGNTCLSNTTVQALQEKRAKTKTVTRTLRTPYGEEDKEFVEVVIEGVPHLADFLTGTLYKASTGECLSTTRMSIIYQE